MSQSKLLGKRHVVRTVRSGFFPVGPHGPIFLQPTEGLGINIIATILGRTTLQEGFQQIKPGPLRISGGVLFVAIVAVVVVVRQQHLLHQGPGRRGIGSKDRQTRIRDSQNGCQQRVRGNPGFQERGGGELVDEPLRCCSTAAIVRSEAPVEFNGAGGTRGGGNLGQAGGHRNQNGGLELGLGNSRHVPPGLSQERIRQDGVECIVIVRTPCVRVRTDGCNCICIRIRTTSRPGNGSHQRQALGIPVWRRPSSL
mmetsp:Transcript_25470/g.55799  ORF Transcript_25470/g.55799 Transcript_25470/m.55799 type:complete len:254 (+) Transcript_25470:2306-3067(+)